MRKRCANCGKERPSLKPPPMVANMWGPLCSECGKSFTVGPPKQKVCVYCGAYVPQEKHSASCKTPRVGSESLQVRRQILDVEDQKKAVSYHYKEHCRPGSSSESY